MQAVWVSIQPHRLPELGRPSREIMAVSRDQSICFRSTVGMS